MNSVVTPSRRSVSSRSGGLATGAVEAPNRNGNSTAAPSPNVNASGGVPLNTSSGCGSRISRANVSHVASRSRWKCMQPFGTPVVPDVNAMIATSSAAVSTGSNEPDVGSSSSTRTSSGPISLGQCARGRSRASPAPSPPPSRSRRRAAAASSPPRSRPRAGSRTTRRSSRPYSARAAGPASPARSPARPRSPRARVAQLVVAPAAGDRRPLVGEQLDRGVHALRSVEQQQVRPLVAWRQPFARERVHQSRPASTIFWASSVGFVNITSWLPGIWTSRHRPSRAENRGCQPHFPGGSAMSSVQLR